MMCLDFGLRTIFPDISGASRPLIFPHYLIITPRQVRLSTCRELACLSSLAGIDGKTQNRPNRQPVRIR